MFLNLTVVQISSKSSISPIAIIGALFIIFGFVVWTNAVLIPYLKIACEFNNLESYLVAFAFYIAYFAMAIGCVLKNKGFKNGMVTGLLVIAIGVLIFIPAAITRQYSVFLLGFFMQGAGLALLQTASNPYITVRPIVSAEKRISIMGIDNKFAGAIAPLILGSVALKNVDSVTTNLMTMSASERALQLNEIASWVFIHYVIIVVALILLRGLLYYSNLPIMDTDNEDENLAASNLNKTSVIQFPHFLIGVVALFLYIGAEVVAGDSIISYVISQNISLSVSKYFKTCTLLAMIVGYVLGILFIPKYLSQQAALKFSAITVFLFSMLLLFTEGYISLLSFAMLGLANVLVWPALWPLALANLGRFTEEGSSLLIMCLAGVALIPLLYGQLADMFSIRQAYWILILIYLFILFYATIGSRLKTKNNR